MFWRFHPRDTIRSALKRPYVVQRRSCKGRRRHRDTRVLSNVGSCGQFGQVLRIQSRNIRRCLASGVTVLCTAAQNREHVFHKYDNIHKFAREIKPNCGLPPSPVWKLIVSSMHVRAPKNRSRKRETKTKQKRAGHPVFLEKGPRFRTPHLSAPPLPPASDSRILNRASTSDPIQWRLLFMH